jgi:hypothetical protein
MNGHKDAKGNFIPHSDSKKVNPKDIEWDNQEQKMVLTADAEKLKNKKIGKISTHVKVDWDEKDVVSSEHGNATKYDATLNYNGKKETFEFTDSINAYNNGDEPKDKDLLYAILMDYSASQESREDFLIDFGYDRDSVKAHKIYDAVVGNGKKLERLFSADEIDKLQKEFQDY